MMEREYGRERREEKNCANTYKHIVWFISSAASAVGLEWTVVEGWALVDRCCKVCITAAMIHMPVCMA